MRKRWLVPVLILTHLGVAVIVALGVAGARTRTRFGSHVPDPMYRIGIRLETGNRAKRLPGSFEQDEHEISERYPGPLADVIRLVWSLKQMDQVGAGVSQSEAMCQRLGWKRCDRQSLLEMRSQLRL